MRSLDPYLSRRAQEIYRGALVTHDDEADYRLERPGQEPTDLGQRFGAAHRAIAALLSAHGAHRRPGDTCPRCWAAGVKPNEMGTCDACAR